MSGKELTQRILSPESLIPAAMLVPVAVGAFYCAMYLGGIQNRLAALEKAVSKDNWNFAMQAQYASEFRSINPNLKTPDEWAIHAAHIE